MAHNGNGYIVVAEFENLIMNIEREVKVRDAIKYCIENFDSQTATNRIVKFWKDELKLQEQQCNIANVVGQSEQLVCDCGNKLTDKELYFGQCLQCDKNIEEAN